MSSRNQPPRLKAFDRLLLHLLAIYGGIALIALLLVPHLFLPAEDAVILFKYSHNLATQNAITFFAGGPHTEGATDFAWMVLLALAERCGLPPFWACAILNVLSLIGLAGILLRLAGRRVALMPVLAIAGAAALFPQIFAAAFGFAVLPDALLIALLVLCIVREQVAWAGLCGFLLCLFRPDAVVIVVPLMASFWFDREHRKTNSATVAMTFLLPGALYFLWRWHYFGEFLPLPFLVKSDTPRILGWFVGPSFHASLPFLGFIGIVLSLLPRPWATRTWLLVFALIGAPTFFYWAMRLDQDVSYRFFYYLPLAAAILLAVNWTALQARRIWGLRIVFAAWLLLFSMPLKREFRTFRDMQFRDMKAIGDDLHHLPTHGVILTTEAGFLPYYSGWTSYDAWGLNTARFAHRFIQPADVTRLQPDLILLHPDFSERCIVQSDWQPAYTSRAWPHMTRNLILGADPAQYELWVSSFGSEFYRQRRQWRYGEGDRECWFVRKDSPIRDAIEHALAAHHGIPPGQAVALEQARTSTTP